MSRLVFYDLAGRRQGELHAICNRGWVIAGKASVVAGGQTTVTLTDEQADQEWLQLGRLVMVEHPTLPPWVGVIDTPWKATSPVQMTLYNAEYLLSLRSGDTVQKFEASTDALVATMLGQANQQEEMFVRQGNADADAQRDVTIDQRSFWDQLVDAVKAAGQELSIVPDDINGQLVIYVNTVWRTGLDTNFLFHAGGPNANMQVVDASIDNTIRNRIIGMSTLKNGTGRLITDPMINYDSLVYRLRSTVVQFQGVGDLSALQAATRAYLDQVSMPVLKLQVKIEDKGDAFQQIGQGNTAIFHAPHLRLPGGVHGWKGIGRMMAIAYDEKTNLVGLTVEGAL